MEVTLVPLLIDWLTLGDLARLHEALCDREVNVPLELRHVMRVRLGIVRPPSSIAHSFVHILSTYMSDSRSRCCECGTACRRISLVCFDCADDARSFRSMVSRNDIRAANNGWRIKEQRIMRALQKVRIVTRTVAGAYLYWRRETEEALASSL